MRLVSRTSTVMALLHASTEALTFSPTPTVAGPHCGLQITHYTSKPTSLPYDMQNVLQARQAGSQNTICGWVGGNAYFPVTCHPGNYCATASTYVGCCELVSCIGIFTTCYDILGPICDASCQVNVDNLICQTNSYCAEFLYPGGSVGYGCLTISGYTTSVLFSTVNVGPLTSPEMTSQGSTVSTVSSSGSTSTSPTPTSASVPTSGGNTLNGGSIAAITIGTIVALAIISALLWLLVRRHTRGAHVHGPPPGSEQQGRSNRTSTVTNQMQDQYSYGSQNLSGAFAPFPKNDVRDERYYATVPENQQAVSPGQEDGMENRQAMYPAGYPGPTMPEMPVHVPRTS